MGNEQQDGMADAAKAAARKAMDTASELGSKAADTAEQVSQHPWFERLARAGYLANGLLHGTIGILAFQLAQGRDDPADQSGALEKLAQHPLGGLLLWAGFAGCVMLGLWHLASAVFRGGGIRALKHKKPNTKAGRKKWTRLFKDIATGITFLAVGGLFALFALGARPDSAQSTRRFSSDLMATPGGSFLLVVLGIAILGVAAYFVHKGVTRKFEHDLALPANRGLRRGAQALGVLGYVAKGLLLAFLGLLFIVATLQHDPHESTGLDGALRSLREQPYGPPVLAAVGAGLVCYAAYLVLRARYATMD